MEKSKAKVTVRRIAIILALPILIATLFTILALSKPKPQFAKELLTQIDFEHFTTSNSNLPSNTIYDVELGANGNLLIGTKNGLCIFNGNTCTSIELVDYHITALSIDHQRNFWIGAPEEGLIVFDGENWTTYNTGNSGLSHNTVTVIKFDNQNRAWIGTRDGLTMFDGRTWETYSTSQDLGIAYSISDIAIDDLGNVWVGYAYKGLSVYDGNQWTDISYEFNHLTAIEFDATGKLWIGTEVNIFFYDGKIYPFHSLDISFPSYDTDKYFHQLNVLTFDSIGRLWIGTYYSPESLAILDEGSLYFFTEEVSNFYPSDIADIVFDAQGIAWIATFDGLYRVTENLALPVNYEDTVILKNNDLENSKKWRDKSEKYQLLLYPIGIIWAVLLAIDIGYRSKDTQYIESGKRNVLKKWIVFGLFGWLVSVGFFILIFSIRNGIEYATDVFVSTHDDSLWAAPITGLTLWITGSILSKKEYRISTIWSVLLSLLTLVLWYLMIVLILFTLYVAGGF